MTPAFSIDFSPCVFYIWFVSQNLNISRRKQVIALAKARGEKIAAVLPIHYPRELLRAYGFHPVEVWGPPGVPAHLGNRHFQSYTCDIVRRAASFLLSGGLDDAELILVPHACDALQGMASVLLDFVQPRQTVLPLYLPRGTREADIEFLAEELRRLAGRLAEIAGKNVSEAELQATIDREEEADAAFARLYRERPNLPLSDREFYTALRTREYLPPEDFLKLAGSLPHGQPENGNLIPLLLSGIVPEPMDLFDRLSELGGRVVADDFACCGRRIYPAVKDRDPFRRMARRLLGNPPDPTRGHPIRQRADHLLNTAKTTGARGVIFYGLKFCEPEFFDLPLLRQELPAAGLPVLSLEVEMEGLSQQVLTRIEAFLEMLVAPAPEER